MHFPGRSVRSSSPTRRSRLSSGRQPHGSTPIPRRINSSACAGSSSRMAKTTSWSMPRSKRQLTETSEGSEVRRGRMIRIVATAAGWCRWVGSGPAIHPRRWSCLLRQLSHRVSDVGEPGLELEMYPLEIGGTSVRLSRNASSPPATMDGFLHERHSLKNGPMVVLSTAVSLRTPCGSG